MKAKLLSINDAHWYQIGSNGAYLPSASTVLGQLKDGLEYVSPYDLKKAQERGIKVHGATELLESGQTLSREFYSDEEWKMLIGFTNWCADVKPASVLFSEESLASKKLGYGGTPDRVYAIPSKDGVAYTLIDIKTTSAIYDKHWMQVAAYAALVEDMGKVFGIKQIDRVGILRLSAKTKKGYQYEEISREDSRSTEKAFMNLLRVYRHLSGDKQPIIEHLPELLKL